MDGVVVDGGWSDVILSYVDDTVIKRADAESRLGLGPSDSGSIMSRLLISLFSGDSHQ